MHYFNVIHEQEFLTLDDVKAVSNINTGIEISDNLRAIIINFIVKNNNSAQLLKSAPFEIYANDLTIDEINFMKNQQLRFEYRKSLLSEIGCPFKHDATVQIARALNQLSDSDLLGFASFIKPEKLN